MESLAESFFKGKKVLVTGHTGFKGSWICQALLMLGADVAGYALEPPTEPSLFQLCGISRHMMAKKGDIRDLGHLNRVFLEAKPDIVIHMAAQPLVRKGYQNPVLTYDINVMGTVNVLECVRRSPSVKSFLNVTTDKVYRNKEWEWGYRECEELNGHDPYSNSKSCSELVTHSFRESFLKDAGTAVSTARAGNVIGGGDFAADRIVPDCIRSVQEKKAVIVRNPHSVRPYQHVIEAAMAYLMIAGKQYEDAGCAGSYNVGPDETDCMTTGDLVELFCQKWRESSNEPAEWISQKGGMPEPYEANYLKLDCSKIKKTFGWRPCWNIETAMEKVVEWTNIYFEGGDISGCMERQIKEYFGSFLCTMAARE